MAMPFPTPCEAPVTSARRSPTGEAELSGLAGLIVRGFMVLVAGRRSYFPSKSVPEFDRKTRPLTVRLPWHASEQRVRRPLRGKRSMTGLEPWRRGGYAHSPGLKRGANGNPHQSSFCL